MAEYMNAIKWLMQECDCSQACATIALDYAHGNLKVAKDYLQDEVAKSRFEREAREFGLTY